MSGDEDAGSQNGAEIQSVLSPISPPTPDTPSSPGFAPLVTVVGFHHARGPEVETWFGADEGADPAADFGWSLLPFMALSDGAHASEEDFSYFTLLRPKTDTEPATSLFGISCTRQLDSTQLINRPADVTRSTVQKAVVVIADSPQFFGMLRERLSIVTQAWFAQRDFTDVEILRRFQESLADEKARGVIQQEADRDQYLGMSLRELIHEFKWQTLVLFKCCLLQPKMLFFGSRCDRLCMVQYSLISLIPGLLRNLQDCAEPELNNYEKKLSRSTSLQSSNRSSLLSFMGLPLQIFGKGSFFGPYTPLQQLDILADFGTKSYLVGSTNSLLLQQKDRYSDILINLDEDSINITSPSLKSALALTAADRRWIDYLTQEVNETWDEANPSRPKTLQYIGSEEFIRSQFEAYILGLISSVKFHNFLTANVEGSKSGSFGAAEDPAVDFGLEWVEAWMRTENYRMWDAHTDANLFAVSEPKHPCAGGLTIDDVQRRIAEQVKELHLDERFAQGREILGRNLAVGREKASTMFNKLYSDVEYLRESQRRRAEESKAADGTKSPSEKPSQQQQGQVVDLSKAQQTVQSAGAKASAYMSSWAAWAGEKRKTGGWGGSWGKKSPSPAKALSAGAAPPAAAAAGTTSATASPIDKDYQMVSPPWSREASTDDRASRPPTHASFSESILSGAGSDAPDRPGSGASSSSSSGGPADPAAKHHAKQASKDDGFQKEEVVGASSNHQGENGKDKAPTTAGEKKEEQVLEQVQPVNAEGKAQQ
ncbi:avl9 protein [Purpureocillium lilacinum]|uniref:Avl9 protein n=1 Tax=Purpureocillium lilacinum TaxID=33203 RepID=A0A179HZ06_PURLI|nr:avl9 protein [Purpureocillium lilacinum]OAQ94718.1 avl9 protein [Purpureocillium lilacinum]